MVFPMRFKDSIDTVLATSFLQVLQVSYQRLLVIIIPLLFDPTVFQLLKLLGMVILLR